MIFVLSLMMIGSVNFSRALNVYCIALLFVCTMNVVFVLLKCSVLFLLYE